MWTSNANAGILTLAWQFIQNEKLVSAFWKMTKIEDHHNLFTRYSFFFVSANKPNINGIQYLRKVGNYSHRQLQHYFRVESISQRLL